MSTSINSIVSLGVLAAKLQVHVKRIKAVANEIGIEPSMRINSVPFFTSSDAEIIAETIRTSGGKKDA